MTDGHFDNKTRVGWSLAVTASFMVVEAAGGDHDAQRMTIHARTSRFTKTVLDPHVNMLRTTTEAMAAILGQVDSLHVAPFDEPLGLPDQFSRRIARNVQLILAEECHFDQVADPAGGSWYVEKLTADLAARAWEIFSSINLGECARPQRKTPSVVKSTGRSLT